MDALLKELGGRVPQGDDDGDDDDDDATVNAPTKRQKK